MSAPNPNRFTISYYNEPSGCSGYRVNIPNYDGGEVVDADYHDVLVGKLRDELTLALQALSDLSSAQTNLNGRTKDDLARLVKNSEGIL